MGLDVQIKVVGVEWAEQVARGPGVEFQFQGALIGLVAQKVSAHKPLNI